ncbi:hypothetical protein BD410DRAFT_846516 [Rickenella mellea]|uniref:CxC2-like cysteine cluster KDZ transposase-associated domain-containing protein n=1 Tax=Rickenella mellea TaxID=50990 RepID=A0A4Y7PH82_9AGAM|nr:hypothetical protein BD410DRAFT_846516 [Rickenella mellea]
MPAGSAVKRKRTHYIIVDRDEPPDADAETVEVSKHIVTQKKPKQRPIARVALDVDKAPTTPATSVVPVDKTTSHTSGADVESEDGGHMGGPDLADYADHDMWESEYVDDCLADYADDLSATPQAKKRSRTRIGLNIENCSSMNFFDKTECHIPRLLFAVVGLTMLVIGAKTAHSLSYGARSVSVAVTLDFRCIALRWNDFFFEKTTLTNLGFRIQLGHDGKTCHVPAPASEDITVIHTNGIHSLAADFCGCSQSLPRVVQILRLAWWPATVDRPQTAVTFATLDLFHNLTLQSKMNVFDFYWSIAHLTDNIGIEDLKYRYTELARIVREFRHIMSVKRSGRGHDPSGILGTQPGECAIECPACPQPGRNMAKSYDSITSSDRSSWTPHGLHIVLIQS